MTLLKVKRNSEMPAVLDNMIENFLGKDFIPSVFGNEWVHKIPAANVVEAKDNFRVEVAAPGMKKDDFKISVDGDLLTISTEKVNEVKDETEKFTRREFNHSKFTRTFTLPETVDAEKISAQYVDGLLNITLPKKEESKEKGAKEIKIS
jgi:HSP20 family protein